MEPTALRIVPATREPSSGLLPRRVLDAFLQRFPLRQVVSFATIGIICTLLFAAGYHVARTWLPPVPANALAITSTAALNFLANRRLTFRVRSGPMARQAVQYFALSVVALGVSSFILFVFGLLWPRPPYALEFAVALLANAIATVFRYVTLTAWVFRTTQTPETLPPARAAAPPPAQAA